jgi:hypothetical protein
MSTLTGRGALRAATAIGKAGAARVGRAGAALRRRAAGFLTSRGEKEERDTEPSTR